MQLLASVFLLPLSSLICPFKKKVLKNWEIDCNEISIQTVLIIETFLVWLGALVEASVLDCVLQGLRSTGSNSLICKLHKNSIS